ncbi:MAG: CBS domain-containing protein [Nitrospinaceae bacterium]|nr:CBS domain-containing protein [Nitrospinaceae bacterium]
MTQNVITAEPDSIVPSAIKGFLDNQVHHLPITHEKKLVGIVSRHNLVKNIVGSASDFSLVS